MSTYEVSRSLDRQRLGYVVPCFLLSTLWYLGVMVLEFTVPVLCFFWGFSLGKEDGFFKEWHRMDRSKGLSGETPSSW